MVLVGLLLTVPVYSAYAEDGTPPGSSQAAPPTPVPQAASPAGYTPTSTILSSDPVRARHRITDQLVRLIDNVPSGESVEVVTYFIGSTVLKQALVRAFDRGVEVRVILERHARADNPQGGQLRRILAVDRHDRSWVRFSGGSTRAAGGTMHQKTWRFSRVGDARWVTVTGSYNASELADSRAHSLMWQWIGSEVYDVFADVWHEQVQRADRAGPLREATFNGGAAYFSPLSVTSPTGDPVIRRLRSLPANGDTVIRIAMYSMWDERGHWVARELASMARRGARIEFFAGPTVAPDVRRILARGGVVVRPGCFRDGTYTHSKDMSATWVADGQRRHRTWIGSDNWTSKGMLSDEAVLGIDGRAPHQLFQQYVERLRDRRGGVLDDACRPAGED